MASLNKVILIGNLTRDVDTRQTSTGKSVCNFGMAVSRKYVDANGQQQEETCFVDISAFGKTAEICGQYLAKGSQVALEGRLKFEQWTDRNSNEKRSKLSVYAENVQFIGSRREDNSNQNDNGGYQQQQQQPPRRGVDSSYAPPPMPEVSEDWDGNAESDIPF